MGSLIFWMSAFIPYHVPGYTKVVAAGIHASKSAVPLPGTARINPFNLFKSANVGYLTDQRSFSNAIAASARMKCVIEIDTASMTMINQSHHTSGTTEVDIITGNVSGNKNADMSDCKYTVEKNPGSGIFKAKLYASAGDPLVSTAAHIDYKGTLTVTATGTGSNRKIKVDFDGKIDDFPAFEAYAIYLNTTKTVLQKAPPPNNTVLDLLGGAKNPVNGSVIF
jgi:hypothetical protein